MKIWSPSCDCLYITLRKSTEALALNRPEPNLLPIFLLAILIPILLISCALFSHIMLGGSQKNPEKTNSTHMQSEYTNDYLHDRCLQIVL